MRKRKDSARDSPAHVTRPHSQRAAASRLANSRQEIHKKRKISASRSMDEVGTSGVKEAWITRSPRQILSITIKMPILVSAGWVVHLLPVSRCSSSHHAFSTIRHSASARKSTILFPQI